MLFVLAIVLGAFFLLDLYLHRREEHADHPLDPTPDKPLKLHGMINFVLIGVIIGAILMSAYWKPGDLVHDLRATNSQLQNLVRDAIFVLVAFASLRLTAGHCRTDNEFSWGPILEVAILFAGIFVCLVPGDCDAASRAVRRVRAAARAGHGPDGAPNNAAYFWLTGALSSFLDNAPTYLVFFELAGGDPKVLMTTMATTLAAISTGAVFMGANTYIGNAPNFMVYAIARQMGVKMPSFFGYMLWSGGVLIPTFLLVTWVFFR